MILSISEHPQAYIRIKWEGLYVALSRVRFSEDIRLLVRLGDRSTMRYISNLKKNGLVKSYFRGYQPCNQSGGGQTNVVGGAEVLVWNRDESARDAGYLH